MKYQFYNVELEQLVLSSLMNNNNLYDTIDLDKKVFQEKSHSVLYEFMQNRLNSGRVADFHTIVSNCDSLGIDTEYLKSLYLMGTVSSLTHYIEELVELYKRRKLMEINSYITDNLSKNMAMKNIGYLEQELNSLTDTTVNSKTLSLYQGSIKVLKTTESIMNSPHKQIGVPSPFTDLNKLLGGFKPGELIILAGRPSVGKTAFATNILSHTGQKAIPTLFISLEMPYEQICTRILSSICNIPLYSFTRANISKQDLHYTMDYVEQIRNWPLFIHDASYLTVSLLGSLLRQAKRLYGTQLVVIDYLQLMESGLRAESREQDISKISRALKLFAKEFNVPIIALSQMSRDIEKRKDGDSPKLSDLRGSGSIEQDADVIIFLYRQNDDNRNLITTSVAKNRNGALGEFPLLYHAETTTFKNYSQV